MFELEYLYEQLKTQTTEAEYVSVLNTVTESSYNTVEADNVVLETMRAIEEASKDGKLSLIKKLKTNIASAENILSKNKEAALKCKPIGLEYKDFQNFMSESEIKSLHKKTIAYLNKFDPSKASEEALKKYITDSNNNVQYREMSRIFGNGKERFTIGEIVVTKKFDKEITKDDISSAVKYLENYSAIITKIQKEYTDNDKEYGEYVHKTGLATPRTNLDIDKLRKNASNHKRALIAIANATYYQMMIQKMKKEFSQAKRIVVKAANYNPRNLKESTEIQNYIDAMYDFHEM